MQLVISDSHRGLTNAVTTVLQGAAWQRCRVHFMRNALAKVNKGHAEMVAATIRTIFAQPTPDTVRGQVEVVADTLAGRFPAVADLLRDAKADLTAFADFPQAHWRKIWSTNPIERLNREVKRRTDVVGIFPNTDALLRLSLRADRSARRVARRRSPLPIRGIHDAAQPARTHRHRAPPRRPEPNAGPARPADGIVITTAKQHATSYTTPRDTISPSAASLTAAVRSCDLRNDRRPTVSSMTVSFIWSR